MELKKDKHIFDNMYDKKTIEKIISYNKKSILLKINAAVDAFFGYIQFLIWKVVSYFK
jgi:hypothetical protein